MNILDLYQDFGIQFQTENHKHCRPGWANISCPFCTGNPGLHLGVHIDSGRFYCWRCGWKPTDKAIAKILGISEPKARELIKQYQIGRGIPSTGGTSNSSHLNQRIQFKPHRLPSPHGPMKRPHHRYLERRGFNPESLEQEWGLLGTGPVSFLDGIDYRNRIIIPIFWEGKQVSFQTRAITDRTNLRYISCPKAREKIPHQSILYGKNWNRDIGICVEGVTDVWRLGPIAFAIFGIEFSSKQARWISKLFKQVIILFDDDPQAIKQGQLLKAELSFRGVDTHQEIIEGDPGGMKQDDANHLVSQLIRRRR